MVKLNSKRFSYRNRQFPGEFKITKLEIENVDLTGKFIQLDIFESIFSMLSGRLILVDMDNIVKNLPILGEEVVTIILNDGVEEINLKMRCYKITSRKNPTYSSLTYTLHLTSEEQYADSFTRISKSFYLKKFEDNVKSILRSNLRSEKPLILGKTKDPKCVIIPTWSPIHAVNWMGQRAQPIESKYRGGSFIFFETIKGIHWVSLDNIIDSTMNETYATISFDPLRASRNPKSKFDKRTPDDLLMFESYEIRKTSDFFKNVRNGMYVNRVRVIDIIDRVYNDFDYHYYDKFDSHLHLRGLNGQKAQPLITKENSVSDFPESFMRLSIKHKGLFTDEPDGNSEIEKWFPEKISLFQQLDNFSVVGTLPGHIGMAAGMKLNFNVPNAERQSVKKEIEFDEFLSGEYIIANLRRTFQPDKFYLSVELIKESRSGKRL